MHGKFTFFTSKVTKFFWFITFTINISVSFFKYLFKIPPLTLFPIPPKKPFLQKTFNERKKNIKVR